MEKTTNPPKQDMYFQKVVFPKNQREILHYRDILINIWHTFKTFIILKEPNNILNNM